MTEGIRVFKTASHEALEGRVCDKYHSGEYSDTRTNIHSSKLHCFACSERID